MPTMRGTMYYPNTPDTFWLRVSQPNPDACWIWQGSQSPKGYGQLTYHNQHVTAHRLAWTLTHGAIPSGLFVCHHCDNPPCCNPAHLFLGTHSDNMRDAQRKGRTAAARRQGELPWPLNLIRDANRANRERQKASQARADTPAG